MLDKDMKSFSRRGWSIILKTLSSSKQISGILNSRYRATNLRS
jgi:hypothetical protein